MDQDTTIISLRAELETAQSAWRGADAQRKDILQRSAKFQAHLEDIFRAWELYETGDDIINLRKAILGDVL